MDITVVMTHFNRREQLNRTIVSIENYRPFAEMIIVDDGSDEDEDISFLDSEHCRVIKLKDKTWINTCIAYNTGLREVMTDAVIIQNAECMHMGDILGHVQANLREGVYLTYACYSLNKNATQRLNEGAHIGEPFLNRPPSASGETGWYNHSIYNPTMYHFCSAIMTKDLYDLGGFDERYADGIAFEDNELLERILYKKKMEVKIIDDPYVIHQYHPCYYHGDLEAKMKINAERLMKGRHTHKYDMKPFNTIYV